MKRSLPGQPPVWLAWRLVVGIVLLMLALATARAETAESCVLRVGWTPYAIFTFAGENGEVRGIDAEAIRTVAEGAGCTVTFRQLPWARILLELGSGDLDATSSASRTAERERFAQFSIPYRRADTSIWVRRGESGRYPLSRLADIPASGMRLGVVVGYHYSDEFDRLMRDPAFNAHVDGASGYEVNISKLLHDRIDGFLVDDSTVMEGWMKTLQVRDQLERHPLPMPGEDLHFMFSRASVSAETVAKINKSLERLLVDGGMKTIVARYTE